MLRRWWSFFVILALASACAPQAPVANQPGPSTPTTPAATSIFTRPEQQASQSAATQTPVAATPNLNAPQAGQKAAPQAPVAPAPLPSFYEPAGCAEPPAIVGDIQTVNGWQLNARTVAMLRQAQALYGGPVDLLAGITQGSYHDNGAASFGTHLGGGAVDLSIFLPGTWTPDFAHLHRMLRALRASGFAAWVRNLDEVYPGSGYHIHAIAIGDPTLSGPAAEQVSGENGYFRSGNGLPPDRAAPDRYGGPVFCGWMRNPESQALVEQAQLGVPAVLPSVAGRLARRAQELAATDRSALLAQLRSPETSLDRALALELWRAAGLLPAEVPPAGWLRTWLAPRGAGEQAQMFWSLFPEESYAHDRIAPGEGAVTRPGDLLLLPSGRMLVAIDETGAALVDDGRAVMRTPLPAADLSAGFDRLRPRYALVPGETLRYTVQPGDTLPELAARFGVALEVLAGAVPDPARLEVGEVIEITR